MSESPPFSCLSLSLACDKTQEFEFLHLEGTMDNETVAKGLVAGYLAKNKLPTLQEVPAIAKQLADFYKATKAERKDDPQGAPVSITSFSNKPEGQV